MNDLKNPKIGKKQMLWGNIIFIISLPFLFISIPRALFGGASPIPVIFWAATMLIGIGIYLRGKFKHWHNCE